MIKKCNTCEVSLECMNYLKDGSCWFNLKEGKNTLKKEGEGVK